MLVERSALRLVVLDLNMEIAGEADNWSTTLTEMPNCRAGLLVADWGLLPGAASTALDELRGACPNALVIVLLRNSLENRQQTALAVGANMFISRGELPERVAEQLRAAAKIRT